MNSNQLRDIFTSAAVGSGLERERIMRLFESLKSEVYRHVPSGSDAVSVQEAFQRFEELVESGDER